jgi:hypothetical protein
MPVRWLDRKTINITFFLRVPQYNWRTFFQLNISDLAYKANIYACLLIGL